jgi:NAD(P)-dependent dehydrogenase (short-subunit alcohol dehydrogenase family)
MSLCDGRIVIVTGAGNGLGRAHALAFAAAGARVVVNDIGTSREGEGSSAGPAQQVVDEIRAAGGDAVANTDDVADWEGAGRLVRSAVDAFGGLDVLVNNAGFLRDRMLANMSVDEWDAVIRVHLRGTFNTSKFAAAHWRSIRDEAANNRIINFTSVSGLHGAPGQPNYAAAKMGIVGLTYSLANSLGRYGATANAISPGAATRMTDSVPDERRRTPGSGMSDEMSPDNVAPVVAYLASERSRFITGQVIHSAGYEVSLYNKPTPLIRLIGNEPWGEEQLAAQIERSFPAALKQDR